MGQKQTAIIKDNIVILQWRFFSRGKCVCGWGRRSREARRGKFRLMTRFCGDRREIKFFQDDVRERKREEGKDIRDLYRCPIHNFLAAIFSSSPSSVKFTICRILINFDFKACFGRMASSLKWKAAPFGSRPQPIAFKMTNNYLSKQRHVSSLSTNNVNRA